MFARARASFCAPMKINSKHRTISLASLLIHRYDIFITSANRIPHKLPSLVSRGNSRAPQPCGRSAQTEISAKRAGTRAKARVQPSIVAYRLSSRYRSAGSPRARSTPPPPRFPTESRQATQNPRPAIEHDRPTGPYTRYRRWNCFADCPDARTTLHHSAINVDAARIPVPPAAAAPFRDLRARRIIISDRKVSSLLPEKRRIHIEILVNSVIPRPLPAPPPPRPSRRGGARPRENGTRQNMQTIEYLGNFIIKLLST